jgi:hypothetical protein
MVPELDVIAMPATNCTASPGGPPDCHTHPSPERNPCQLQPQEASLALVYVVNYLTCPRNLAQICANPYKKTYLQFLSSVVSPPRDAPEKQGCHYFQGVAGGALKLWLESRWWRGHFQSFDDRALQ